MSISSNFPTVRPSLLLDFAKSRQLDPRITFSRASTATRVNEEGLIEAVAANVPRFDCDPTTMLCKGLLIEEQRTNLSLYSDDFSNASWVKPGLLAFGSGSTVNAAVAPDGTTTADLLTENTASGGHYLEQSITGDATNTYTFSVYLKPNGRSGAILQVYDWAATANSIYMYVNISTGQVITPASATGSAVVAGSSVTMLPSGWCKLTLSGQPGPSTGATMRPRIAMVNVSSVYTGDGVSGMYMWGAQYEVGAFPTSYIPTAASQVTRSADAASMTGANFSQWYAADQGTFVGQASTLNLSGTRVVFAVGDPSLAFSSANTMYVSFASGVSGRPTLSVINGGTAQGTIVASGSVSANTPVSMAAAYNVNDFASTFAAAAPSSITSGKVPIPSGFSIGSDSQGWTSATSYLNGTISKLVYYPIRLTNAQLQALTR